MVAPIQTFKVEKKAKADTHGLYRIFIDRQPLEDLIDDLVKARTNKPWTDRERWAINAEALKASATASGRLPIVVSAIYGAGGFVSPEDVGLSPFVVMHEPTRILWTLSAPNYFDDSHPELIRTLTFDRTQYLREVAKVL